jgi:hypothetical protein
VFVKYYIIIIISYEAGDLWKPELKEVNPERLGHIAEAQGVFARHEAQARFDALYESTSMIEFINELMQLPLPIQDKFLLLRASLQQRMAHLARVAPWAQLETCTELESRVTAGALDLMQRPPIPGSPEDAQTALPLRQTGLGLCRMTALEEESLSCKKCFAKAPLHSAPSKARPVPSSRVPKTTYTPAVGEWKEEERDFDTAMRKENGTNDILTLRCRGWVL